MNHFPSKEQVEEIKKKYPTGTKVQLEFMSDSYSPVPPGSIGIVTSVDDIGTVHCKWNNGQGLGLVIGEDKFVII